MTRECDGERRGRAGLGHGGQSWGVDDQEVVTSHLPGEAARSQLGDDLLRHALPLGGPRRRARPWTSALATKPATSVSTTSSGSPGLSSCHATTCTTVPIVAQS